MRTVSISGFGGAYEDMCQRMLWRGVAYLAEIQPPVEMWHKARQNPLIGVLQTDGDDLKALERHIIREGDDVTGAMRHAVLNHLAYIHHHSVKEWLVEAGEHRPPEDFFEWDDATQVHHEPR